MERQYTPQYLDMDPGARAIKTRIANLEQQLENERGKSQHDALVAAKEELASARATTRRLNQQMTDDKQSVQTFSRRMAEFQVMQEELRGLEQMRLAARQRLLGLEASETARKPRTQVLESAVMPDTAWRPLYWRDAGISLAASLALGFLAVWFVEFFNRPESAPTEPSTVIIPQPWISVPHAGPASQISATNSPASLASPAQASLLPSPQSRELSDDEVRKLLTNATPENLPVLVCMLFGLTTAEVTSLRVSHVDTVAETMTIPGEPPRTLRLEGPLRDLTAHGAGLAGDAVLFPSASGGPLSEEDLVSIVTFSAHDASLVNAQGVSPSVLRHTYLVFLVRQGLRFSDLGKIAGRIPSEQLSALALLAPESRRVGPDAVSLVLPAVAELGST
jgi:integrase